MSKIDTLKKQFPELNMSLIDIFQMMDPTKSNKYLQLFCKLFSKRYRDILVSGDNHVINELTKTIENIGIDPKGLSITQMHFIRVILYEQYHMSTFYDVKNFIDFMERGLIPQNDVGKYSTFEDINCAVSLASLKQMEKDMAKQVVKVHDDENWLAVLPLTFESSVKYGAGTKWCTTYSKEKHYFAKYWNRGILIYFINKKTGYKFAAFKDIGENDLSFWNSADSRTDYLELTIEDYMFPIVKKLLKSGKTNSEYLDYDEILKVCKECSVMYDLPGRRLEFEYPLSLSEPEEQVEVQVHAVVPDPPQDSQFYGTQDTQEFGVTTIAPNMRA